MANMTLTQWAIVLNNLKEENQEVEIVWLDGTDEWALCHDCEIFEDGFVSEYQAYDYLVDIEKQVELLPQIIDELKEICNNENINLQESVENIMDSHEIVYNKKEYIWGNHELHLDETGTWKYYHLYDNELCDMDYSTVHYMAWVMLESLEKN